MLAEGLSVNNFLKVLKMSGNRIQSDGFRALSTSLAGHALLEDLDVSDNDIEGVGLGVLGPNLGL